MGLYRDEAIVLRTQKLGEADRIITMLTRANGRVRAVAKGVRRTSSRFGSRLEPFTHVDLQLAEGRSLDVITQAETLAPYGAKIGMDYEKYTAGTVMLETAERLVVEDKEPALQQFLLLVGGLRTMAAGERNPSSVLDSFLLGRSPWPATPPRSRSVPGAVTRAGTGRSAPPPAGCCARAAGCRARPARPWRR